MNKPNINMKPIVAFGDSITKGHSLPIAETWVYQLEQGLSQRLGASMPPVINAGVNGHSSRQALERLQADVLDKGPGLVLVEFGGNDAGHPPTEYPERHVPLEEFRANMRRIHDKIAEAGGHVAFVSFPPVMDDQHRSGRSAFFAPYGGMDGFVEIYRQATRQLALELMRPLFDLDLFVRAQAKRHGFAELIKPDGIHLTPKANKMVAEAMTPVVVEWVRKSHAL